MDIRVNGNPLALDTTTGGSVGESLALADDLIEKTGSVIVGIKVDGAEVDAEGYAAVARRSISEVSAVEIHAESAAAIRIRALETLLELVSLARHAAEEQGPGKKTDWHTLRTGATDLRDAFAGLFAADELSFVQLFAEVIEKAGDEPDAAARAEISSQAGALAAVFTERLAELTDPAREMHAAAALFEAQAGEFGELPVLLQTGKEDRAMKAVLYFIEVFNKVIRLIPELRRDGIDTDALRIEGAGLAEFYGSFNSVLRSLTDAFENKDAVLIGDLAEYEVLPRMKSFFAAIEEALPGS